MNNGQSTPFDNKMFQHMPSPHSHASSEFHAPPPSTTDQEELIARKKLEQKRRFQQRQGHTHTNADSLMQAMFSDLKLQPQPSATTLSSSSTQRRLPQSTGTQSPVTLSPKTSLATDVPNVPQSQTRQFQTTATAAVAGAADWSKVALDDELNTFFHHERPSNIPTNHSEQHSAEQLFLEITSSSPSTFAYPSWCAQPIVYLPLVYQQVFEASCISNVIQTSVLYPILLLSGLRQDQLSFIWSQVNLTQPGILIKEELFMALALIALAQNNNGVVYNLDRLYNLSEIPVPHFQIQQQQSTPTSPPPPPVQHKDDFADFTVFSSFEQQQPEQQQQQQDNSILLDFDEQQSDEHRLHLPNIRQIPSETQSISSFELPMPRIMQTNNDDNSQNEIADILSSSPAISNANDLASGIDAQSTHSTVSSEYSKQERVPQFSFPFDDNAQFDAQVSIWLRCFEKCHSILSTATELLSSIESPSLCTEVLQQPLARDYVYHLQEIFLVNKRIHTATAIEPTTTTAELTSLWKQIVVVWTNLQSFFSTAHLHLFNDDQIDYSSLLLVEPSSYCSICLLSTIGLESVYAALSSQSFNTASLTFAGRSYHTACANFYLNLIDGILPSLRRSS